MAPSKTVVMAPATNALVTIGKPILPFLVDVLRGKNAELARYAKTIPGADADGATPTVYAAAWVLGEMGHPDATGPLLEALAAVRSDADRAALARALARLAPTPKTEAAFQNVFDKLDPKTAIMPMRVNAQRDLIVAAFSFQDARLVPWLIKRGKGHSDFDYIEEQALLGAIRFMSRAQMPAVQAAVAEVARRRHTTSTEAFRVAAELMASCGEDVDCYLASLEKVDPKADEMYALKALHMVARLGNAGTSSKLVKLVPKLWKTPVKVAALDAVERLTPDDTAGVVDALQAIVDESKDLEGLDRLFVVEPVKRLIRRLRVRSPSAVTPG
jgi:hypothetical protein